MDSAGYCYWVLGVAFELHSSTEPSSSGRIPLSGFPRSLLVTAEKDPLRDDGKRLANALQRAGATVQHEHFSQEAHGFPCSEGPTPGHDRFMSLTKAWIEAISAR